MNHVFSMTDFMHACEEWLLNLAGAGEGLDREIMSTRQREPAKKKKKKR